MKSRVLMAALVVTLLMGVRAFASDCGPCDPVSDPCGSCDSCSRSCDLFSGLKNLVACSPCSASECGPCDGVVACNPCDEAACNPCDDASCNDNCGRKFTFGKRLKHLFDPRGCNPCDEVGPCDANSNDNGCNPCDEVSCDSNDACGSKRERPLRDLFKGFRLAGRCNDGCGSPCDNIDNCGTGCGPCDEVGACDEVGNDSCGSDCGQKFGHLLDKPRRNVKRFFDGFSFKHNTGCNPCDAVSCDPCEAACNPCDALPEACK